MLGEVTKKYNVGIIAPRSFDSFEALNKIIGEKLPHIRHIYTNDVSNGGRVVFTYALEKKIPFTVYPIPNYNGGTMYSNGRIIKESEFIYILDDGESTNADLVEKTCKQENKKYRRIKTNGDEKTVSVTDKNS